MYTVIVNADTNRVSSFYNQAVVVFLLTLSWHAPPTPKWLSHKSTKPRSGKSGTVLVIQTPGLRLLDHPLHEDAIASLHQNDKHNSKAPYCTRVVFEDNARPVQTTAFGGGAATGQVRQCFDSNE
jgi:hypothetical protein